MSWMMAAYSGESSACESSLAIAADNVRERPRDETKAGPGWSATGCLILGSRKHSTVFRDMVELNIPPRQPTDAKLAQE